jgi:hypothetical protein
VTVPFPDPVLVSLLSELPAVASTAGGRVSTVLDAMLPALRVVLVGHREAPSSWEATPLYQVEVWADDEFQAGSLAWDIANTWPSVTKVIREGALVTHRWLSTSPFPSPDPETGKSRYLLTVGIRLSGAPT